MPNLHLKRNCMLTWNSSANFIGTFETPNVPEQYILSGRVIGDYHILQLLEVALPAWKSFSKVSLWPMESAWIGRCCANTWSSVVEILIASDSGHWGKVSGNPELAGTEFFARKFRYSDPGLSECRNTLTRCGDKLPEGSSKRCCCRAPLEEGVNHYTKE